MRKSMRVVAALMFLISGCEVDPYCLTCRDGEVDADGGVDSGRPRRDGDVANPDAGPVDAGRPDGCIEGELCNDYDDDCDGFVDEGIDLQTDINNCGECGNFCIFPHALASCAEGGCSMGDCDVGFYDLNGDSVDGCEYSCPGTDTMDALCNLRDDDCDGSVDEDVDKQNDEMNCGVCGRVCSFPASTATCTTGVCEIDSCNTGFYDLDGVKANGCEYACTPASDGMERCNAVDDDCDGIVDEGRPSADVACGGQTDSSISSDPNEGACMQGVTRCEFLSIGGDPSDNGLDDDDDGMIDESTTPETMDLCQMASSSFDPSTARGSCFPTGRVACDGQVRPTIETCNEGDGALAASEDADEDCDGTIDEGNPDGGAVCGTSTGLCEIGFEQCISGDLVCVADATLGPSDPGYGDPPQGPVDEICDGLDQNCDMAVDDGNPPRPEQLGSCSTAGTGCRMDSDCPDVGTGETCDGYVPVRGGPAASCDSDVGACSPGYYYCGPEILGACGQSGTCSATTSTACGHDYDCPSGETCEGETECSSNADCVGAGGTGVCVDHIEATDGTLTCLNPIIIDPAYSGPPYRVPSVETCNAGDPGLSDPSEADEDCDGNIDEGNPEGGAVCGTDTGVCSTGTQQCVDGALVCSSAILPNTLMEVCDGQDQDCDGRIDEGNPSIFRCSAHPTQNCVMDEDCPDSGTGETCDLDTAFGSSCGSDIGQCSPGQRYCGPTIKRCGGATGATCTSDADCGGSTCVTITTATGGNMRCVDGSVIDPAYSGAPYVTPTTEVCNGLDDDCDQGLPNGGIDEAADGSTTPGAGGGGTCGTNVGECVRGVNICTGVGGLVCNAAISPNDRMEVCDNLDNDCDGNVDEGNPNQYRCSAHPTQNCVVDADCPDSGTGETCNLSITYGNQCSVQPGVNDTGYCEYGSYHCGPTTGGAMVCQGGRGPRTETCNEGASGLASPEDADDDCDGAIDEGITALDPFGPGGGGSCGSDVGACTFGRQFCVDGGLVCAQATWTGTPLIGNDHFRQNPVSIPPPRLPGDVAETCNGIDDDCDGTPDDGNPGSSTDSCNAGGSVFGDGSPYTLATAGPDGRFGTSDDVSGESICELGDQNCTGGSLQCQGAVGPGLEGPGDACDRIDNDCDGTTDEHINFNGDVSNCGACGTECVEDAGDCTGTVGVDCFVFPNAVPSCTTGTCGGTCLEGFYDLDPMAPGCEYACDPTASPGNDGCNGRDDDCDGTVDEDFDPTDFPTLCNQNGVCAGSLPTCPDRVGGAPGRCSTSGGSCLDNDDCTGGSDTCRWQPTCIYTGIMGYESSEQSCDGDDNDCDGNTDEPFTNLGQTCWESEDSMGFPVYGICRRSGTYVCDTLDRTQTTCDYGGVAPIDPGTEACNGLDDDCDGIADNNLAPGAVGLETVTVDVGGVSVEVMAYEASRPDAPPECSDGIDNDGDGNVDFARVCSVSRGTTCTADGDCPMGQYCMPADTDCADADDNGESSYGLCSDAGGGDTGDACANDGDCTGTCDPQRFISLGDAVGSLGLSGLSLDQPAPLPRAAVACSRPDVTPWVNVTFQQAQEACCNLNPSGACTGSGSEWRLCGAPAWEDACDGPSDSCNWSYSSGCGMTDPLTPPDATCNGAEYDSDSMTNGDQDALYYTGAFDMCFTDYGGGEGIYDMSGNVREWVDDIRASQNGSNSQVNCDAFPQQCFVNVRGGSYNHIEAGRSCQWDFTVTAANTSAPNTGFRCCMYGM